jgi:hypothetical protein
MMNGTMSDIGSSNFAAHCTEYGFPVSRISASSANAPGVADNRPS